MEEETVVASALIQNMEGLILVFEGQDGYAGLPGGTSERGETPEETAVRESLEETGLRISIERLVCSYNLIIFNKDGTEKCRFLHHLFLASTKGLSPQPLSEWKNIRVKCRWITLGWLKNYKKVWPLPEEARNRISDGMLDLGNMGELKYQML